MGESAGRIEAGVRGAVERCIHRRPIMQRTFILQRVDLPHVTDEQEAVTCWTAGRRGIH